MPQNRKLDGVIFDEIHVHDRGKGETSCETIWLSEKDRMKAEKAEAEEDEEIGMFHDARDIRKWGKSGIKVIRNRSQEAFQIIGIRITFLRINPDSSIKLCGD